MSGSTAAQEAVTHSMAGALLPGSEVVARPLTLALVRGGGQGVAWAADAWAALWF